jgi:16S rRNA (cytosine967-C5)-methyltransferase
VKGLKKPWAKNLVNAVLRNFQRNRETLLEKCRQSDEALYCTPTWLLFALKQQWPDQWQAICENNQHIAPLTARINLNRKTLDQAQAELNAEYDSKACAYAPTGLRIAGSSDIASLPGHKEGWLSIQDEAAQLAVTLMELNPAFHVLDACAAPGGKTAALLEDKSAPKSLVALELDPSRTERIQETLDRLDLQANVICADAGNLDKWWDGKQFDRILLDAPCSATGVIRRHPDIKLLRRQSDIDELADTQKMLLNRLWKTLKPGGILVYATCSILKTENEMQIAAFLQQETDAVEVPINAEWGEVRPHGRQLFPQLGGHDGFYYAKLQKS